MTSLSSTTRRRLEIQGFERVDDAALAAVARWLRLAFALCALLAAVGVALASPAVLLMLAGIALVAAASPVHPFDHIYNHGIRRFTGTGPLPRRLR
jgi:fatty acid desaturase